MNSNSRKIPSPKKRELRGNTLYLLNLAIFDFSHSYGWVFAKAWNWPEKFIRIFGDNFCHIASIFSLNEQSMDWFLYQITGRKRYNEKYHPIPFIHGNNYACVGIHIWTRFIRIFGGKSGKWVQRWYKMALSL